PVTIHVPSKKAGFLLASGASGITSGAGAPLVIEPDPAGVPAATFGIVATTGSTDGTTIQDLTVQKFANDGILAENAAVLTIGEGVTSNANGSVAVRRAGLHVTNTAHVAIVVPAGKTPTHFDGNTNHGILVNAAGSIKLQGSVTTGSSGVGTI